MIDLQSLLVTRTRTVFAVSFLVGPDDLRALTRARTSLMPRFLRHSTFTELMIDVLPLTHTASLWFVQFDYTAGLRSARAPALARMTHPREVCRAAPARSCALLHA